MKSLVLKSASYIFHPLWLPTFAIVYYFSQVSFMYTFEQMFAKTFAVIILTAIVPSLFIILLKPLKLIDSLDINNVNQRRIPLLFFTTISAVITNYVFDPTEYRIPFYFFSAAFVCGIISFLLTFINHKISLHAIGIAGFTTFIIGFNIIFSIELISFTAFCILCVGWVLSSRLYLGAHNVYELITGVALGSITQVMFMQYWAY